LQVIVVRSPVSACCTSTVQRAACDDHDALTTVEWKRILRSMPFSAAVSRTYARILSALAIACSSRQGLNS
jgi:hypothetical protein